MTTYSELHIYTFFGVLAACLTTTAGLSADISKCPNLSDGAPQYYNDQDGQCHPCPRCDPGEGLSEVCGDGYGQNARCEPCPVDTFQPVSEAHQCAPCRECDNTMNDLIACTPETDRKCGLCKLGYFRHKPDNDHCVRCQDEDSWESYPDCLRTTPLPVEGSQNSETLTPFLAPTDGPLLIPVAIAFIVVFAVCAAIVIFVLVRKCCHNKCPCRLSRLFDCMSKSLPQRTVSASTTRAEDPESPPETRLLVTTGSDSSQNPRGQVVELTQRATLTTVDPIQHPVNDTQSVQSMTRRTGYSIIPATPDCYPTDETSSGQTTEFMQEARQILEGLSDNQLNEAHQPTDHQSTDGGNQDESGGDDHASDTSPVLYQGETGSEENRRGSDESSASKATQTSLDSNVPTTSLNEELDEEAKRERFLERFNLAKEHTKEIPISEMHHEDVKLLKRNMCEQPQSLPTSRIFHYVKFANLFKIPAHEVRMMQTAEDVLDHLTRTMVVELSVADILQKLQDCRECCDVVRDLVNQILKREQPYAG